MMKPQKFTGFCVFCYKSGRSSKKESDNGETIEKFPKFVGKYAARNGVKNIMAEGELDELKILLEWKLECCTKCKIIIEAFCNLYHELKVVE